MAEKPAGHILIECPIYIWCNRQGILYVTKFHYRKDFSLWFNMKSYYLYFLQKFRYQFAQYAG